MFGAIAEYDKAMLVQKLRWHRELKKARGERYVGRRPYGLTPHERHIIERMRAMRRTRKNGTPGMTLQAIADRLNSEGERSKDGGPWTACKVNNAMHSSRRKKKPTKEDLL